MLKVKPIKRGLNEAKPKNRGPWSIPFQQSPRLDVVINVLSTFWIYTPILLARYVQFFLSKGVA